MVAEERAQSINDHLELAKSKCMSLTANLAIENFRECASVAYFIAEALVKALLATQNAHPRTHEDMKLLLGRHFVKPGLVDKKVYHFLGNLYLMRLEADYSGYLSFDRDDIRTCLSWLRHICDEVFKRICRSKENRALYESDFANVGELLNRAFSDVFGETFDTDRKHDLFPRLESESKVEVNQQRIEAIRRAVKKAEQKRKRRTVELVKRAVEFLERLVASGVMEKYGAEVWVFGSLATGEFREGSDLDLVVMSAKDGKELSVVGDILLTAPGEFRDLKLDVCIFDWLDDWMQKSIMEEGMPIDEFIKKIRKTP